MYFKMPPYTMVIIMKKILIGLVVPVEPPDRVKE